MRKLMAATMVAAALAVAGTAAATTVLKTYTVHMTGAQETPKGSPTGKGTFKYKLDIAHKQLCYSLKWSGIGTNLLYAHIHKAPKGKAGNIVLVLSANAPVHQSGCVKTTKTLLTAIQKHPSAYYVNVHTKQFPGGAIRGQLP